jgi:hypothetical protein
MAHPDQVASEIEESKRRGMGTRKPVGCPHDPDKPQAFFWRFGPGSEFGFENYLRFFGLLTPTLRPIQFRLGMS